MTSSSRPQGEGVPDLYARAAIYMGNCLRAQGDLKIAAGLGHLDEAEAAFLFVRRHFFKEGNGYDAAMVSLDLALLFLKAHRMAELRELAEELRSVFEAENLHAEARAALLLFQEAVRQDRATVKLAEEVSAYLKKARTNPMLRFRGRG